MAATAERFVWYDLETFGRDPRRTRIAQFAAIVTDQNLEQIEEPVVLHCKPATDLLPSPTATAITGLSPIELDQIGLTEAECLRQIHAVFDQPKSCGVGWNTLRFDDEFLRFGFYRNFIEPYKREYSSGSSRWDLLDFARLVYALRPSGIHWPNREDGAPSFRLGDLAAANGVTHEAAHDALSDVEATLGMARLLQQAQPKLWDYHLKFRDKRHARSLLDVARKTPLLHVSGRYPAERGCSALIAPIAEHPSIGNQIIACDLRDDPSSWINLDLEEMQDRLFAPASALPEGVSRLPVKLIHLNRCPALVQLDHVSDAELERLQIDRARCLEHAQALRENSTVAEQMRQLFAASRQVSDGNADVDQALYDGFLDSADERARAAIRASRPDQLAEFVGRLRDPRGDELLFRYRARNWPETLSVDELGRWDEYRRSRLAFDSDLSEVSFESLEAEAAQLLAADPSPATLRALADLKSWSARLQRELA